MRPSLRFLGLALLGWGGMRVITAGTLPGADFSQFGANAAKAPALVPTVFPAIEPVEPATPIAQLAEPISPPPIEIASNAPAIRYVRGTVGVPVALRRGVATVYHLPPPTPADTYIPPRLARAPYYRASAPFYYSQLPPLDQDSLTRLASLNSPGSRPGSVMTGQSAPIDPRRIDRLQLSTWALLRNQQAGVAGSRSPAGGGQLGASQAGARLIYNYSRRIALSARMSSEVGRRGGEVAGGLRVQPLANIPLWLTAERRQAIGKYGGGRSAFALFAEGGLYQRPLPWDFSLDAYLQGGIVGAKSRDLFVDGALTVTRPLFRNFSAGFGIWGGAQPGLARLDAGPRLTMRVRKNLKVHVDWRQKLIGNARPGSGPSLTLAGDF